MCEQCKFRPFSHGFHCHSDIGSLDGVATPKAMVKRAKALGMNALAITDHGHMTAIPDLFQLCEKEKLIFIPGQEIYLLDPFSQPKTDKKGNVTPGYCHCTVHYLDLEAYQAFCKISRAAWERSVMAGGELKPLVTMEELQGAAGHIVISSGCLGGMVQKQVAAGRLDLAEQAYQLLRGIAGPGKFFVEVFPHTLTQNWVYPKFKGKEIIVPGYFQDNDVDECSGGPLDVQSKPNQFCVEMALKYGDPIIVSHDSHLCDDSDKVIQDLRLGHNWRFSNSYKMFPSDEAFHVLQQQLGPNTWTEDMHNKAIDNSYEHAELFKGFTMRHSKNSPWMLPSVQTIYGENETRTGKAILLDIIKRTGRLPTDDRRPAYLERLKYELDVFQNHGMDAIPYILLAHDVVSHERARGNLTTLRGSASGSLTYYLCGLSTTDPIKHDLSFDRHLTPAQVKVSLPDADLDMASRDLTLEYGRQKYGDKFALISTVGNMRMKSAIKDLERKRLGSVRPETNLMTTLLPSPPQGTNDSAFVFGYEDADGNHVQGLIEGDEPGADLLRTYAEENPEIWAAVKKCMGIAQSRGVHAAGVVIAQEPLHHWLPLIKTKDGDFATDYTMKPVEWACAVKMDFLGLNALAITSAAMNFVKETTGVKLEWDEFPHDDRVYTEIIQKDKVAGVFQLCSEAALRPWVTKAPVCNINDISNLLALVRPGALDQIVHMGDEDINAAEFFVQAARGERAPFFIHEDLKPILGKTYGIILLQEQISKIFSEIGGVSPADAVVAMKAVSKKDREKLEYYCSKLKNGCLSRGWSDEQSNNLIESIMKSAKYSFNCLSGDQEVQTAAGTKRMDTITPEDFVACVDELGVIHYDHPMFAGCTGHKTIYELQLTDGSIIKATPDHRLMSNGTWKTVQEILDNDLEIDVCLINENT